jgi:phosphoglycerate dehydrogenase-like enzyme
MQVVALRRQVAGDEPVAALPLGDPRAADALAGADHVIDLLPASPATEGFFDAARLAALKRGAVFYNIGRGNTVDQEALRAALESGQLGAAYLDVTTPEPLPPDHALWTTPNCFITPHTAGGHHDEAQRLVRHFLENLARFTARQPLLDRVL